jgi:hypothetical protein
MAAGQRESIKASIRWGIFYRDGFACRYCGAQAGAEGVELVIDHVLSVAEGGDNSLNNLVTACKRCNGGKGARSLKEIPTSEEVVRRVHEHRSNLEALRDGIKSAIDARKGLEQEIVNLKCDAYQTERCHIDAQEIATATNLLREFGADQLLAWYCSASRHNVKPSSAIQYVCGCARRTREREMERQNAE